MGRVDGFLIYDRELPAERDPQERVTDYREIYKRFSEEKTREQASRCMDCGIPFCHQGCPLGNNIPEFNDAVYEGDWKLAIEILSETNNFPEFTGRICPAPCEGSCVLGINKPQVTIEYIEKAIAEKAFDLGYIKAEPPRKRTDKKVAVIGSGPAGLAAADQLNKQGHLITVFERDDRLGGLLRYGIPDFKLEKWVVERRIGIMMEEGVQFRTNAHVGINVDSEQLLEEYDALVLCGGSTVPRDLGIPGRELKGIHYAMDFLTRQNKLVAGDNEEEVAPILATHKNVVVIGGGDTGSDCVGTSNRHGAASMKQLEIMPMPPQSRDEANPWPEWPLILRTSSSHEEGCEREWEILTEEFTGNEDGEVTGIKIATIEWHRESDGKRSFKKVPGSERIIPCDLVLLAMGFVSPDKNGLLQKLGIQLNDRDHIDAPGYQTNLDKVFAAGDMRRGQSLVVWAIAEGREAADAVGAFLEKD